MSKILEPKTIDKQVEIIMGRMAKNDEFKIEDAEVERLRKYLNNVGYDKLIYPYESILYVEGEEENGFREQIHPKHIINLYKMDKEICELLNSLIIDVEVNLKSRLKNWLAEEMVANNINSLKVDKRTTPYTVKDEKAFFAEDVKVQLGSEEFVFKISSLQSGVTFRDNLTFFDVIDNYSFGDFIELLNDNLMKFKNLTYSIYSPLGLHPLTRVEKVITTLKYVSKMKNNLAHNTTVLFRGHEKDYINANDLYLYRSLNTVNKVKPNNAFRTKTNHYPFLDIIFFLKKCDEQKTKINLAAIFSIYYKYAFSKGEIIFSQEEIFGNEILSTFWDTFNKNKFNLNRELKDFESQFDL